MVIEMTLLAGIYMLNSNKKMNHEIVATLLESIARTEGTINSYSDNKFTLIKWDFGAFKSKGYFEDEKSIAAITGEPYFEKNKANAYSRFTDLKTIIKYLEKNDINVLTDCNGSYSLCYYNKATQIMFLSVDKLGVRPIYYYRNEDSFIFASTLRVIESMDIIPKRFNLEAFIEKQIFGVALGTNTKYCDIKVIRDGQFINCNNKGMESKFYYRWEKVEPFKQDLNHLKKKCYDEFINAVSIRSSRDDKVFALLSGGLDSRSVVSALNDIGKKVIAFNFALPGEKDSVYGKKYAEQINIQYHTENRSMKNVSIWNLISNTISNLDNETVRQIRHPKLIFAGDGGSVGLGHVYLNHELLNSYKNGGLKDAIDSFLKKRNLPDKIFKESVKKIIRQVRQNSLINEINDLKNVAPGRDFYLFLLRNDQRRHLHEFWEEIDLVRVEFLEPFYDSRVLSLIASAPIEPFIGHKFYYDWLNEFTTPASSVPWQTYPGHKPCPIEIDERTLSQWDKNEAGSGNNNEEIFRKCKEAIFKNQFPNYLVNRFMIYAAIAAHKLNLKDVEYIFKIIYNLYCDHMKCSSTKIENCSIDF